MKKNLIVLAISLMAFAQVSVAQVSEYKKQQSIYSKALTYNDYTVARTALFNMMELQPNNNGLLDTLALLYFEQRQYISSGIVAQEAAQKNPNNLLALELAGTSFENVGLRDKELEHFEKLYLKNQKISVLYKIAFLQYQMKRYNDADASSDIIIKDPEALELPMVFGKSDKTTQQVKMIAAAYRVKALVAYDQQKKEVALQYFKKALEYSPEFEIAASAVTELEKG